MFSTLQARIQGPPLIVRTLNGEDASAFQALRLLALRESPTAFGSSYEEEYSRTNQQIVTHLVGSPERKFVGCFDDVELLAVVGVGREQSIKERHIAFIRSMYVTPPARGKGVGRQIMLAAIAEAAAWDGVEQITLSVTASNHSAILLYRHVGFVEVGRMPRALRVDGTYHDELSMVRMLAQAQS